MLNLIPWDCGLACSMVFKHHKMNRMKVLKYTLFLVALLLLSIHQQAQSWYEFTGTVSDELTALPLPDYPVQILEADSGNSLVVYTDELGTYSGSLLLDPAFPVKVTVKVIDCEGIPHLKTFDDADSLNVADFEICGDQPACAAEFGYELLEDAGVQFLNLSLGDFSVWYWDFGDGTGSDEFEPLHLYNGPGDYYVTLTVNDSIEGCQSTYAEWVSVGDTVFCKAEFSFELDSLNNGKNTYLFDDLSGGDPYQWHWDFGDGNVSSEQHPTHVYEDPGTYTVCLTISTTSAGEDCEDQVCQILTTPEYFNFGGHVFLGNFPLNIDEDDSSNVAVALLFRRVDNLWYLMDSIQFWKFGYYWFEEKAAGEYLIRVDLLPVSEAYGQYAPSYYGNTIGWAEAGTFLLKDPEQFDIDISMKPLAEWSAGPGVISGILQQGQNCLGDVSTQGAIIYLLNSQGLPVDYSYVSNTGDFYFSGLPLDTYTMKVEMAGSFGERSQIQLTKDDPVISNVELQFECNAYLGTQEPYPPHASARVRLFPQPASDHFTVELSLDNSSVIRFALIDLNGITMITKEKQLDEGIQEVSFHQPGIRSGLYLLKITDTATGSMVTKKLLINR